MFQNMLVTSLAPLSSKTEMNSWENQPFTSVWPENRYQDHVQDTTNLIQRPGRRLRTAFTTHQVTELEKAFARNNYANRFVRFGLADSLKLSDSSIKCWFQNRRMRKKKESLESSSDSSSECFSRVSRVKHSTRVSLPSYALQLEPTQANVHIKPEITNQCYLSNHSNYFQVPTNYAMHMGTQSIKMEQPHHASKLVNNFNIDPICHSAHSQNNYSPQNQDNNYPYYQNNNSPYNQNNNSPHNQNNNMNAVSLITNALNDFHESAEYNNDYYTPL